MTESLRTLLTGIVDYAGMFPPARLDLEAALTNFLRDRGSDDAWMLGRFVYRADQLEALAGYETTLTAMPEPIAITALGRGGDSPREFFDNVRADLADIARFRSRVPHSTIDGYEVRLPARVVEQPRAHQLSALIGTTAYLIETSDLGPMRPFFECPVLEPAAIETLVRVFVEDRDSADAGRRQKCAAPGWKLRCGGFEASAFPQPRQVALVLAGCCAARIPWKGTAGLHHPLRHFDETLQVHQHGFINVFVAGVLAHANQIDEVEMQALLEDTDAGNFHFNDTELSWGKDARARASLAEIAAARAALVTSFGSCSFDEPRQDLRSLGWL